jgi:hypothetical protein
MPLPFPAAVDGGQGGAVAGVPKKPNFINLSCFLNLSEHEYKPQSSKKTSPQVQIGDEKQWLKSFSLASVSFFSFSLLPISFSFACYGCVCVLVVAMERWFCCF